jgi:hypothetical protein
MDKVFAERFAADWIDSWNSHDPVAGFRSTSERINPAAGVQPRRWMTAHTDAVVDYVKRCPNDVPAPSQDIG